MLEFFQTANNIVYTYILIAFLLLSGLYFTIRTRGVQFRYVIDAIRLIFKSDGDKRNPKSVSSFQAFSVSLASRVGTGNLAGVATAIAVGGPGAVFWMWVTALLGAATGFVEATLAQIYKRKKGDLFYGGPAYYVESGIGLRWMAVLLAVLIIITFAFGLVSVQCNTMGAAMENQFGVPRIVTGLTIMFLNGLIIFLGIRGIAKVTAVMVPFMAISYLLLAVVVVCMNISQVPQVFYTIVSSALGLKQVGGGLFGVAIMQGIRRGLFSNEAGMGSAPIAAAAAHVSHPVNQGLLQALGVFIDTLVICTCTALVILLSGVDFNSVQGVELTQMALCNEVGPLGSLFITIALMLFAFSTLISDCFYGLSNLNFFATSRKYRLLLNIMISIVVVVSTCVSLEMAWEFCDFTMAICAMLNLIALLILSPKVINVWQDYVKQRKSGVKNPKYPIWWEKE